MDIIKKPYEISLWEDVLVFVITQPDGLVKEYEEKIPEDAIGQVTAQYYKERKICVIGSDTMDTPIRAIQSKLSNKVNGENTLTFNMYSHYYDTSYEEHYVNPFIGLLVNERKIKVRYGAIGEKDTKWYDLVIKNIQENSETKTYSYTAKDLYVNELSKSGFNLELNSELENNMGNITTLAEIILDESDWQLKEDNDILRQTIDEPLYEIVLNQGISAKDMQSEQEITLSKGKIIYAFYNNIVNQQSFLQFLYADTYEINDDYIITNSPNWFIEGVEYDSFGKPTFASSMAISDSYRGERLVRKVITKYDSVIDKYVNVYDNNGSIVHGYSEIEYTSPATVRSFITNPNSYSSDSGWEIGGASSDGSTIFPELEVVSVPDVRDVPYADLEAGTIDFSSCLKLTTNVKNQVLYNSGIVDYRHHINGFVEKEQYVFRVKYGKQGIAGAHGAYTLEASDTNLKLLVAKYSLEDGIYTIEDTYFSAEISSKDATSGLDYSYVLVECEKTLTYEEMIEMGSSLGFFIQPQSTGTIYIEDVQFFSYVDHNGVPLLPDEIKEGEVKTKYFYYDPNTEYTSIDNVKFIYKGYEPANFLEVYNSNYEKIRSITASESNRFNLIQELCEIFECWPKFEIEHNPETGEILLDENYRPKKWVSFHEFIGKDNFSGFRYGINLKSIQRTIDSSAIVSKMIVKNNSNEFATDGFCSIARASENPSGENFLLDFSYYIQQGMLTMAEITNDLYLETNGYIGYYKKLKKINDKRDLYIAEQSGLLTDISEYSSQSQFYHLALDEAKDQLKDKYIFVKTLTGYTFEQLMKDQSNDWWKNDQLIGTMASIGRLKAVIKNYETLVENVDENLKATEERYEWLTRALSSKETATEETEERLLIEKEELHKKFYKKYSRFLQEGSWISEDYIDDNLYYLDSMSTLHTSSQPKVTYNINVLELSKLEGYENYLFALGDKTFIEDTEFFGWFLKDGVQTPYKEEIVVTEIIVQFDSPDQNQIKVQNYKTQFEDLFQRIAATTQSIEYSTGQYNKATSIVESDGTINITTLQNSIANNALILQNAKDQSVIWDETGITTTSLTKPSEIIRIVSGGIFLSIDGGVTWGTGITGKGINASYITSGQINAEEVNILNGSFPSFRWDGTGISAYEFSLNQQTGEVTNFNYGKFVRLDQYGLYGIDGYTDFNSAVKDEEGSIGEDKIWKYSNFALTWRGFQIKSKHDVGGYISITSDNDLVVNGAEGNEFVKIGLLNNDSDNPIYGLRLKDSNNKVVLEQSSQGKVWIRNEMKIGANSSTVSIGYLDNTKMATDGALTNIHEVINANDKFVVYEDGSMIATEGTFTGTIYATGGKIGNLDIEALEESGFEVYIESDSGNIFKNNTGTKTLTAYLYRGATLITEGISSYQWYRQDVLISGATSQTIEVDASEIIAGIESVTYSCAITYGTVN